MLGKLFNSVPERSGKNTGEIRLLHVGFTTLYEPLGLISESFSKESVSVDIVFVHGLQGDPIGTWTSRKAPHAISSELTPTVDLQDTPTSVSTHATASGSSLTNSLKVFKSTANRKSLKSRIARIVSKSDVSPAHTDDTSTLGNFVKRETTVQGNRGTTPYTKTLDTPNGGTNCFWPQDLLPSDCPSARILTWGYDTKVTKLGGSINKNSVYSHGKDLLFGMRRLVEQPQRPIIFVAHSLGGIVVKEMLAASATSDEPELSAIVARTAAVVFLGTPHRGSIDMAKLGNKARKLVSAALVDTSTASLDTLGLRNADLERCQEAFSRLWSKYDFRVKTFQEGLGLSGFNIGMLGDKVVPSYSSLLGDAREHAETLQANHMEMCRFSGPNDPNGIKVRGELKEIYMSIKRAKQPDSVPNASLPTPTLLPRTEPLESDEKAFLEFLHFPYMDQRRYTIQPSAPGTCQWLYDNERFKDWQLGQTKSTDRHFLWIKGRPGSGKSTLMRDAYRRLSRTGDQGADCIAFFFDTKGDMLCRSEDGLYRCLLYQLLKLPSRKDQLRTAAEMYKQSKLASPRREYPLRSVLQQVCLSETQTRATAIFVDALDECDGKRAPDIANFLRDLANSASAAGIDIRICISSRHMLHVTLFKSSTIVMEHCNLADITQYIDMKLLGCKQNDDCEAPSADIIALRDVIVEQSAGIFLWVKLTVEMAIQYLEQGRNMKFVHDKLQLVPQDLQSLYKEILQAPSDDRFTTLRFFQWVCLAGELRLREWRHILTFIRRPTPSSLRACRESEYYAETDDQLEKQIRHISMGLVEVTQTVVKYHGANEKDDNTSIGAGAGSLDPEAGESRIVQVIHASVREFFLRNGGYQCLALSFAPVVDGYLSILSTCLDYIAVSELDSLVLARERTRPTRPPSLTSLYGERINGPAETGWTKSFAKTRYITQNEGEREDETAIRSRPSSVKSFGSASSVRYSAALSPKGGGRLPPLEFMKSLDRADNLGEDPSAKDTALRDYLSQTAQDSAYDQDNCSRAAFSSLAPSIFSQETRLLEDYPALLSYVITTFFIHVRSAEKEGGNLHAIWDRMQAGMWERWSALAENIPQNMTLARWAKKEGSSYTDWRYD
ncbi:hypothetical protein GQ53DRAFT_844831 [Thozetella sp. PMI_491]|nr:hypothetical protein GQ53DRAFT_844831 [Thozetella sp. PMI_491]